MAASSTPERPPLWRDVRILRVVGQVAFGLLVVGALWYLYGNFQSNMARSGLPTGFGFLDQPAGFQVFGTDITSSTRITGIIVRAIKNTALTSFVGIGMALVIGILVGVARLSSNWLVRKGAALYVETLRNIPILIIIIFTSTAVILQLPQVQSPLEFAGVVMSNRGLWIPWFTGEEGLGIYWFVLAAALIAGWLVARWRTRLNEATGTPHHRVLFFTAAFLAVAAAGYLVLGGPFSITTPVRNNRLVEGGVAMSPEYAALTFALAVYTASHIAEIVRGSILAIHTGQNEAANALALNGFQRMRFVILPQAFRIMVPPLANQFLNLTKNSSLAVAIGFPEVTQLLRQVISNGRPAPQMVLIMMAIYLAFSLFISVIANFFNRRLQLVSR